MTPRFKSANSYHQFAQRVLRSARYVRDAETDEFLTILLAQGRERTVQMKEGSNFWRAQVGHEWEPHYEDGEHVDDFPGPCPPDRMKPLRDRAREGRANPKGIPYLYGADRKETAIAEVRPWLGSLVSLAQFKTLRPLTLVDCSATEKPRRIFMEGIPEEDWDKAVWWNIDHAFSRPLTIGDDSADYVPTQVIAELFKVNGCDGLVYRSAFAGGHNLVLFELDSTDLINCSLYEVKSIDFNCAEVANPYFISKYYPKSGS